MILREYSIITLNILINKLSATIHPCEDFFFYFLFIFLFFMGPCEEL